MEEREFDPATVVKRPASPENGSSSSSKRVKVEPDDTLPDSALLYHFAYSTWQCANRHLSQTFIPASVQPIASDALTIHLIDPLNPTVSKPYEPDVRAAEKALSLQILAIDTLKIGIGLSSLSDTERVTFGLLFGKIGIQVVQALRSGTRKGKGKEEKGVDHQKLLQDIEEQVNISVRSLVYHFGRTNAADGPCPEKRLSTATMPAARASGLEDIAASGVTDPSTKGMALIRQGKTGFAKRSVKQYSETAQ